MALMKAKRTRVNRSIGDGMARRLPDGKPLKKKMEATRACGVPVTGVRAGKTGGKNRRCLQRFGQFGGEGALGFRVALSGAAIAAAAVGAAVSAAISCTSGWCSGIALGSARIRSGSASGSGGSGRGGRPFGRLGRISAKNLVFERRSVETADDSLHFIRRGGLDKRESLGFLRLVVPDHFHGIRDEVFGGEPLFNIVRSDPHG